MVNVFDKYIQCSASSSISNDKNSSSSSSVTFFSGLLVGFRLVVVLGFGDGRDTSTFVGFEVVVGEVVVVGTEEGAGDGNADGGDTAVGDTVWLSGRYVGIKVGWGVVLPGAYVGARVEHGGKLAIAVAYPALHQIQVNWRQVWNALPAIDVTLGGIVTDVSLPQLSNALFIIVTILVGITIDINEVPNNAFTPSVVILVGSSSDVKAFPSNAYWPIEVKLVGRTTDTRFVL